ncbi:hypothetical protein SCHPADRAFT_944005 [Schizopora paradoxa]|uniref:Uncharacterized protein n=1 Tax=Schizopora paradoxa TaxID=27342 RepID=A0A0H2RBZ8_9AGAM|nr:hypothetical protein SCHPADRAFT_944005 [Schizopora paradoxa]
MASDATAPNIPGPGRNLGLLFDALGKKFERIVNNWARELKLGPDEVAREIRSLRRHRDSLALVDSNATAPVGQEIYVGRVARPGRKYQRVEPPQVPASEDVRLLKRLCRRLLKYCRSQDLSTQLRALEEVTALATDDPYIREMLADVLRKAHLVPKYNERELQVACDKALISIKDVEIYQFWSHFTEGYVNSGHYFESNDLELSKFRDKFVVYLNDPDVSFLVARLLRAELGKTFFAGAYKHIWKCYVEAAYTNPGVIEYDTLYTLFDEGEEFYGSQCVVCDNADHIMELARHFPIFSDSTTVGAMQFRRRSDMNDGVDIRKLEEVSHKTLQFLTRLCNSEDLLVQLHFLRNLQRDEVMRDALDETILANEALIAYVHISQICPPNHMSKLHGVESYDPGAAVLFNYFLHGSLEQQALATILLSRSMEESRYFNLALDAVQLKYGGVSHIPPPPRRAPFNDRCHIRRNQFWTNDCIHVGKREDMDEKDVLHCSIRDIAWLHVEGDKHPFDVTGHYPILAGYDASGKELYVARIFYSNNIQRWRHWSETYISDGARRVSFIGHDGKRRTTSRFDVMVLRHNPYDIDGRVIPEGAKLQTGPVYWKLDPSDEGSKLDPEAEFEDFSECSESDCDTDLEDEESVEEVDTESIASTESTAISLDIQIEEMSTEGNDILAEIQRARRTLKIQQQELNHSISEGNDRDPR